MYNSKSGVGTVIGAQSGKIIGCEVRSKDCRKCKFWQDKGMPIPDHNCFSNWHGTSKGMEPDVGVSIVKSLETKSCLVSTLIMDDDATTTARIQSVVDHPVEKWSDFNHVKKSLGSRLWKLQPSFKQELTSSAISHLQRCFSYAVHSNKHDPMKLKCRLSAIVPHVYGLHDMCDSSWCSFLKDPSSYRPTMQLSSGSLKTKLHDIFKIYEENAAKIAPCASTKENESFNSMVASKAPKNRHYSALGSLEARVQCAIAQKNLDHSYVSDVNKACGLSPGKITMQYATRLNKKRKYNKTYKNTVSYKKKKLSCRRKLIMDEAAIELREGITYKSGVDQEPSARDITVIVPPIAPPPLIKVENFSMDSLVHFDIETTSLSADCDIVQLSALHHTDNRFNTYVVPSKPFSRGASDVTGLSILENNLCHNGSIVNALLPKQAMQNFLLWLQDIDVSNLVLVAHNCAFDSSRLLNVFAKLKLLDSLKESVVGFIDTLPLFKEKHPNMPNYRQVTLAAQLLNQAYDAHNSAADVETLMKLTKLTSPSVDELQKHSFTISSADDLRKYRTQSRSRQLSFEHMVTNNVVSTTMAKKMADSGLDMPQIKLAHSRDSTGGIGALLSETNEKKARVTKNKSIIAKINDFLSKQ